MKGVRAWLGERHTRLERLPRLEDALLGANALRYAAYRLRLVMVRALLRTGFRLTELALFTSALSFDVLGPVLLVRSLLFVLEGLWWGALETLRRDVRELHSQSKSPVRVIRQWMALSCCAAGVAALASIAWVLWGPSPFEGFDVIDVFLLGCATRLALDSLARTYHSGVYGIRRVYRPGWSILLVDIADITFLLASFLWLGAWGLGLSLVAVGVLRTSLAVLFTRRTYVDLRLAIGSLPRWFRSLRGARWSPGHSVASAFGNAVGQIDALLVLGLLIAPLNASGALLLAVLFHGVAPLQAAAFSWSRLFYFDFKRLEVWGSPFLLQRFEAFVGRVSLWVPLPIGLVTLGLLAALWRGPFWFLALGLTALAGVRARLSLLHIRAYSLSDYAFLRKLFLFLLLVVLVTPLLGMLPPDVSVGAVALVAGLGLVLLGKSERLVEARSKTRVLGVSVWLRRLANHSAPVRVGVLRVDRRLTSAGKVMRALQQELAHAWMSQLGADSVAWFAPADDADGAALERLVTAGAGTLREIHQADPAPSGKDAVLRGVKSPAWQRHIAQPMARSANEHIDVQWLRTALQKVAPAARCIELSYRLDGAPLGGYSMRELRRLVLDAARGRSGFARLGNTDATVLAPGGEPWLLVLVPRDAANTLGWRAEAAELLRCANVALTLAK
jgi:hypothetical protein